MLCENCGREMKRNWGYCPFCGSAKDNLGDNLGSLADKDLDKTFFGGKIFGEIEKQFERQLRDFNKLTNMHKFEIKPDDFTDDFNSGEGISISISTGTGREPKIEVRKLGEKSNWQKIKIADLTHLNKANLNKPKKRKLADLFRRAKKRVEAKSSLKRLASGLRYEIEVPGVKSIDDVEIRKLENSIEINAFAKDIVHFKIIPADFVIKGYYLEKDMLIIEIDE